MATDFPDSAAMAATNNLFAAVDMGTNSFKLLIVLFDSSTGHFFTLDQRKESVLLGLDTAQVISPSSVDRAVAVLGKFQQVMHFYHISSSHVRVVATSAVREASNQSDFTETLRQTLDLHIDVLSGLDEARLIYQGVLQFCSLVNFTVLTVDIGGGSTEFVIGNNGNVLHAISLKLGHVTLTQTFIETEKMREHIRSALASSGLVDKIKEYKIDKVVGSSGTIKAIEKAVCEYTINTREIEGVVEVNNRDWKFNEKELTELVERLEVEGQEKREAFFKKRAKFIVAGAILLEEIFKGLGIEEMEVSGYALGEGVIKELIWQVPERSHVLNTNERWMSVVRLAMRFNNKKRMRFASTCVWIAKVQKNTYFLIFLYLSDVLEYDLLDWFCMQEIFEGIRRWNELNNEIVMYFEEQDFEYLEAACLLHNIGLYAGKKGYHKKSYCMVMVCS